MENNMFEELFGGIATLLVLMIIGTMKVVRASVRMILRVSKILRRSIRSSGTSRPVEQAEERDQVAVTSAATGEQGSRRLRDRTGVVFASDRHEAADAIFVIWYPKGWTISHRVYGASGRVARILRCSDKKTVSALKATYMGAFFELPEVHIAEGDLELVLQRSEAEGLSRIESLLNGIGKSRLKELEATSPLSKVNEPSPTPKSLNEPARVAVMPDPVSSRPTPAASEMGTRVEGVVRSQGVKPSLSGGYPTFEVTLDPGGGAEEKTFRGSHLKECLARLQIKDGDRIAVTPIGRKDIPVPDGPGGAMKTVKKSLFEVERVGA